MAYKKLVINGEEYPLVEKLSELENDVGFVKSETENSFIGYVEELNQVLLAARDGEAGIYGNNVHLIAKQKNILRSESGAIALDVSSQRISNLATPIDNTDAVNKGYVDAAINNLPEVPDIPITSDDWSLTIDGKDFVTIEAYDSMNLTARNGLNFYVENDMYLSASNISVSGDMHVQAPQSNDSVVTKKYVDDAIAALKALLNLQ